MVKTRIFQVIQLQQDFIVGGVFNNKIIGSFDLNPTNKDWSRPAWMEIQANSTPVAVNDMTPFVPNYWGDLIARVQCWTYKDNACGVSSYKVPGQAFTTTKAALYKDITTNPKVILCEDPIGPQNNQAVQAGSINEFGVYGGYSVYDPIAKTSNTVRCHWDFDGKLISKGHDYVVKCASGPINQAWVNANFTAPTGWVARGLAPVKQFIYVGLNALMDDGSVNNDIVGFALIDPSGVAPTRLVLPGGFLANGERWMRASITSVSDDMRYCTFRYVGRNPATLKWNEPGAVAFDLQTGTMYFLKDLLGLDPWTAYKVTDADFAANSYDLICGSIDAVKDGSGATTAQARNLDLLQGWQNEPGVTF